MNRIRLGNLAGIIMSGSKQLVRFKFVKDQLQYCQLLCSDDKLLPFEFWGGDDSEKAVRNFFFYRIVPDTRINIEKDLKEIGIDYYDPEAIIRYQKGRCVDDDYWVDCI